MKKYYITTPIYYVNDKPHIGHAYTNIVCDAIARFKRLDDYKVMFLTGTDEHGRKVERAAAKKSISVQEYVDIISGKFFKLTKDLHISNSDFIRTTDYNHKIFVQSVWEKLIREEFIYLSTYSGWYSVRDESYIAESELINGRSPSGDKVEWLEEPSYFFKLSKFQDKLIKLYEENPSFIMPESRRNEVLSFVKSGLKDLSISRVFLDWGIRVPGNEKHTIYVWLDALFNYVSSLGKCKNFWPADLHVVGKDILRFHAVYWPAFLMAAGMKLPKRIFAHGWWTTNTGEKISKSAGNVIDPYQYIDKYNVDYLRYYLLRDITFGNDGHFSEKSFVERINSELVNKMGNLIYRTTSLIFKNCHQRIPEPSELSSSDKILLDSAYEELDKIRILIDNQDIKNALNCIINLCNKGNIYIDEQAPWNLVNINTERMYTILYVVTELIRFIVILMQPFIPNTAEKILDYFGITKRNLQSLSRGQKIKNNVIIGKPEIFFQRIEI